MEQNFNLNGQDDQAKGVTAGQDAEGMVFNLSNVNDEVEFEVLPKGTYNAIIEDLEYTTSQSSGEPMIHATYSITDAEYENRKIHDYYMLKGKGAEFSLPRLKQLLTRVCPEVSLDVFNPTEFTESGVAINRQCQLKLIVQTQKKGDYKGEKRNSVREVLASADLANSFLG
jgi:hypothetical protein